jgi:Glycosyl hydrolase family 26
MRMGRVLATVLVALALASAGAGATPSQAAAAPVALGAFIHNSYMDPGLFDAYAREVGRRPVILGSYKTWAISLIDFPQLEAIWSRGAVPMVTWEPSGNRGKVYKLADIARGRYDNFVRASAQAAAAWGHPIFLRFAHEMNGAWYPWGRGVHDGTRNRPRDYKAAWRHLVGIFRAYGATNVKWVWAPNQNFSGRFPFRQYYPGDRWVDWVGIDGFNWSTSPRWQTFSELFASSYNALVSFTERPVIIAETGTWEHGGSKAAWVSSALKRELPKFGHVRALTFWSVKDSRGDLRVDSSRPAIRALRSAVSLPKYAATRQDLLSTPERLGEAVPVTVPSRHHSVAQRIRRGLKDNYVWLGGVLLGACLLVFAFAVLRSRRGGPPAADRRASL